MGMMPPKLAQILINLTESKGVIWDPFCGSGTIVMEGLLMGRNMIGSDIDPKRVEGAKKNVNWLKKEFSIKCDTDLFVHDATKPIKKRFDAIAFEGDLGIPHNQFIKPDILQGIIYELDELYVDFFRNIKQIKCRVPIVCALPFFRLQNGKEIFLDKTIREIENMGFVNTVETRLIASLQNNTKPLQYSRPDQAVGRAIYKLKLNI